VCNPAAVNLLKRYMDCVLQLESFSLLFSFAFSVGPLLLVMVLFAGKHHTCHGNGQCLASAVSMTVGQIISVVLYLVCVLKIKPQLTERWVGLGLPREQAWQAASVDRAVVVSVPREPEWDDFFV
jgi:hypothetical protein